MGKWIEEMGKFIEAMGKLIEEANSKNQKKDPQPIDEIGGGWEDSKEETEEGENWVTIGAGRWAVMVWRLKGGTGSGRDGSGRASVNYGGGDKIGKFTGDTPSSATPIPYPFMSPLQFIYNLSPHFSYSSTMTIYLATTSILNLWIFIWILWRWCNIVIISIKIYLCLSNHNLPEQTIKKTAAKGMSMQILGRRGLKLDNFFFKKSPKSTLLDTRGLKTTKQTSPCCSTSSIHS